MGDFIHSRTPANAVTVEAMRRLLYSPGVGIPRSYNALTISFGVCPGLCQLKGQPDIIDAARVAVEVVAVKFIVDGNKSDGYRSLFK